MNSQSQCNLARCSDSILRSKIGGVYASDELRRALKGYSCFIVNLDLKTKPESHWVAIAFRNQTCFYFCNFASVPKRANAPDTERRTIRISSLRMTPVDLPSVPILLNETFITALWDTGAEKSFLSEEAYRRYFSYRPRQKTKDRLVTAPGDPCCHLGRVELQIRFRDF
ncbi:uncharacterized protein TNCV_1373661 [Trichonephila clavipes]|uniref:Uncharacterized protein n=1 Tax=Trichonephila clavipes TaxID=2585209 RepID=A0A8X6WH36_TRICX|nr:uncharacterized protein TNCV_1373661 [Trichonephila clavipes]